MNEPFDILVVILLRNEGTIGKTFDEIAAQIRKLRRLFLRGPYDQCQGEG